MSSRRACHLIPTNLTTLLLGGRIHSPAMPDATAMAVRDGAVVWLGSDDVGPRPIPRRRGRRPRRRLRRAGLRRQPRAPHLDRPHARRPRPARGHIGGALPAADRRIRRRPIPTARSGGTAGTNRAGRKPRRRPPTTWTRWSGTGRPTWPASTCIPRRRPPPCAARAGPAGRAGLRPSAPADRRRPPPGSGRRARPADP